jgi:hypothetical protein
VFTVYKDHPEYGYRTTRTVRREKELAPLLKDGWRRLVDAPPAPSPAPVPVPPRRKKVIVN